MTLPDPRPKLSPDAPVGVIVALRTAQDDPAAVERLRRLGLHLRARAGTRLIGSIAAGRLESLRADAAVRNVEVGVPLSRLE